MKFKKKKDNCWQVLLPVYHSDGDMVSVFVEKNDNFYTISDYGITTMRISFYQDIDEDKIRMVANENSIQYVNGVLFCNTNKKQLFETIEKLAVFCRQIEE